MSGKNTLSPARVSPTALVESLLASDRLLSDIRQTVSDLARTSENISGQRIEFEYEQTAEEVYQSRPMFPLSYISEDITNGLAEISEVLREIVSELQQQVKVR